MRYLWLFGSELLVWPAVACGRHRLYRVADVFYHALIINFDHNAIGTYRKDTNCYVRLVRTGQQE